MLDRSRCAGKPPIREEDSRTDGLEGMTENDERNSDFGEGGARKRHAGGGLVGGNPWTGKLASREGGRGRRAAEAGEADESKVPQVGIVLGEDKQRLRKFVQSSGDGACPSESCGVPGERRIA